MGDQSTQKIIFTQCQSGLQGHGKLIKSMNQIYEKTEHKAFASDFFHYLKYAMSCFKREPAVERVIDFVAKFLPSVGRKVPDGERGDKQEDGADVDSLAENILLQETFDFLLKYHSARDKAVRFRCCQLINKLLANLGEDAVIDDELYDRLYECMLDRLKDKCPVVRYHAVLAMARLQDPTDENCPVIKAYLFLLNCDPNADVRRSVLTSIAPSTKTLPSIAGRTRDVKDTVRKTAYEVLSEKVHVKALSIAQRLQLLNEGLNDRSDMVKQACSNKLLQSWMRTFEGNILTLLKSLDVEDSTQICSTVLEFLFKGSSLADIVQDFKLLDEKVLIPEEELTSESVFYWQMVCKYIHDKGNEGDEYLDKVLPNCIDFCGYAKQYVDGLKTVEDPEVQLGREFIIEQLLLIASYMDTADSASRKALENLLHSMIIADHVSHRLVKPLVLRICQIRGDNEHLVQYFAELVSEIREPITVVEKDMAEEQKRQLNLKIASIRVKLHQFREELDDAVKSQNFTKAAELKNAIAELDEERASILEESEPSREEIRTERNDPLTIQKCQTIISEMLQSLKLTSVSSTLQMMIESQIVPGIQNEDAEVRNMAMQALGLCCYLSKDLLVTYMPLFMQASQIDVELVRVTALQIMFDLLLIYGLEVINTTEASSNSSGDETSVEENADTLTTDDENSASESTAGVASKLVAIISSFLDMESSDLRTSAAEGLAKLLLSGRIVSPKILSHLILLWYNPLSEDDTHLRDCLGTFFPLFALASRSNQEIMEEAFLPTLKTLLNAPATSPLAEVDVNNVAELLVPLTNSTLLSQNQNASEISQDNPGHDNLSEKVCNEILSDPTSPHVKLWIRILNQMEVSPDNEVVLKDLRILCHKMMKTVKDKLCLKTLSKFQGTINDLASKFVTNDDDLENIEIEQVQQGEEEESQDEAQSQTPKRKKVRGLYSQNITLESEVADLDISQDVSLDIDASCLMRSTSAVSNGSSRRSRKNTTELAVEDDDVFLKPDAPAQKSKDPSNAKEKEDDETINKNKEEVSEDDETIDKNKEKVSEEETKNNKDTDETESTTAEKRKSDVTKTTPEKRPRTAEKESPEKGRSRSKERKQRSLRKNKESEKAENKRESPQKSPTKEIATSSTDGSKKNRQGSEATRVETRRSSLSPNKAARKETMKSPSRSPERRTSSKRKASPENRSSKSPPKRQRSTDLTTKPHLKRKASPEKRDSMSPGKRQRSKSHDSPTRIQQKKNTNRNVGRRILSRSPRVTLTDVNKDQLASKQQHASSKNVESLPTDKQKVQPKVNTEGTEKNIKDKAIDKSSPTKTRGSLARVVVDTPEGRSRHTPSVRGLTPSIAETPDNDLTPSTRRSLRGKASAQKSATPVLPARSTRPVRNTPRTAGAKQSPRPLPSSTSKENRTPIAGSPRTSSRLTRSVRQTPDVVSPRVGQARKETAKKKADEPVVDKKKSIQTVSGSESLSSPGSSSGSKSSRTTRNHEKPKDLSDSSQSPSTRPKVLTRKTKRSSDVTEKHESMTTTTDDDEEEDQIRRRIKSFRKGAGSKSNTEKSASSAKAQSAAKEVQKVRSVTTGEKPKTLAQKGAQKSSSVVTTLPRKPSTPKSQKSDSDVDSVFSSPGSARSTRSAKLTDLTRGTRASRAKVVDKQSAPTGRATTSTKQPKVSSTRNQPRWK